MTSYADIPLARRSTAEQVSAGLADKIMRGDLRPGQPLKESSIATALGISRGTVREAVRLLEQSALVTYEFNRGAVVRSPSMADVAELYDARVALEVAAVGSPRDEGARERVRAAFDTLARGDVGVAGDTVPLDLAFHAAIVSMLDSTRIDAFFAQLVSELEYYFMALAVDQHEYDTPGQAAAEHQSIRDAIEARDHVRAAVELEDHIRTNQRRVEGILTARLGG